MDLDIFGLVSLAITFPKPDYRVEMMSREGQVTLDDSKAKSYPQQSHGFGVTRFGDMMCGKWIWDLSKIGWSECSEKPLQSLWHLLIREKDNLTNICFTRYLLIDSRPRRAGLVLDSAVPIPLLSTVLDIMFQYFLTPMVSLMSAATMTTVAGGVRSALVIDIGWTETVVTSVYEYREVKCTRSVRAGRLLVNKVYKMLYKLLQGKDDAEDGNQERLISFAECEDIMCRVVWCRPSNFKASQRQSAQLDTVEEQDENDIESSPGRGSITIPLQSTSPPRTLEVPFEKLADVCEDSFFDPSSSSLSNFDDDELPLHLLIYQHLLQLPLDVRAICMSRIMFTGGCSNVLGIKERAIDEVTSMIDRRGWTPVFGKSADQLRNKQRLQRQSTMSRASESSMDGADETASISSSRPSSIATTAEVDAIEAKLARNRHAVPVVQGQLRAIHSLGPWAGASLLCQLRVPATATIDRELWLQQGANGASHAGEVDLKAQSRQSMGAGGLIRGSGGQHTNWTLGAWGAS